MDDESYEGLFRPIMDSIMANYQPDAIVLQSGEHCYIYASLLLLLLLLFVRLCTLHGRLPAGRHCAAER
jgi:hypothetical protein